MTAAETRHLQVPDQPNQEPISTTGGASTMFPRGIAVIGLGYIGLPTSAALALNGVNVKGVDVNPAVVAAVGSGEVPIVEPDLDQAVAKAHAMGSLTASTTVPEADAFLIAVPTPFREGHQPNLDYVESAAEAIAPVLTGGEIVILESTSPPGTTRRISERIAALRPDLKLPHEHPEDPDVYVAHCPERVLPGRIMVELVENDRVVGGLSRACGERAAEVYRTFCEGDILITDAESAEMAKLVENSFRDVNIAFANELAGVTEHLGLDVWEVIRLANRHPRVNVLNPGPGVGGHCIAVDPWFIVSAAPEQSRLIRTAREVNDARPGEVVAKIVAAAERSPGPVALLGLAFKANIDDLRESPAVTVAAAVAEALPERELLVVEPHVTTLPATLPADRLRLVDLEAALEKASVLALLVDHHEFAGVPAERLRGHDIVDTRGVWR